MELREELKSASAPEPGLTMPSPRLHEIRRMQDMLEARIRRRRFVIILVAGVVMTCLLGLVVAVRMTHARDEADFVLAARTAAPLTTLSDGQLVAEGDFACRWLSQQERAFWNHGSWFDRDQILTRYLRQTRPVLSGQWGPPRSWSQNRGVVADAAWSQLCGGTWYWHRPHGPRGPSGGGADGD